MFAKFPLLFYLFHLSPWQVPSDTFLVGIHSTNNIGAYQSTAFINHPTFHLSFTQSGGPGLTQQKFNLQAPVRLSKTTVLLTGLGYERHNVWWTSQNLLDADLSLLHRDKEFTTLVRLNAPLRLDSRHVEWQVRELYRINENWSLGAGWDYIPYRPDPLTFQCIYTHENLQLLSQVRGSSTSIGFGYKRRSLHLQLILSSATISPSSTLLFQP